LDDGMEDGQMAKTKTQRDAAAKYPYLAEWFAAARKHGCIYSRTDVGRTGMGGTVLLWTIRRMPSGKQGLDVCWPFRDGDECAKRLGFSLRRRAFVRNGCGYNRAHDAAYGVATMLGHRLMDVPTIETLNQPE